MSLFTKSISDIQFNDVQNFVNINLREDQRLDYKEDFPSDLAKLVMAFANTDGGIILIGIRADQITNVPETITGIPLRVGLEERVINITMSNITPPISPEVKVCPYKSNAALTQDDRAIIVVRVPQSDVSPHSHSRNNSIWVRNHNRCDQASLDVIERLLERRNKGILLLENMKQEANQVSTTAIQGFPLVDERIRYFEIKISPLFPLKITFNKSTDDFLRTQIGLIARVNETSPKLNGIDFISRNLTTHRPRRFFSVSRSGYFIWVAPVEISADGEVYAERIIQILTKMLRVSITIFEKFGYFGRLSTQTSVVNIRGMNLISLLPNTTFDDPVTCQEANIKIERIYSWDEIKTNENELLKSVYSDLLRGFQTTLEENVLTERLSSLITHLPQ